MDCPYLDSNYPCCQEWLNMQNLNKAMAHCSNHFEGCAVYLELSVMALEAVGAKNQNSLDLSTD